MKAQLEATRKHVCLTFSGYFRTRCSVRIFKWVKTAVVYKKADSWDASSSTFGGGGVRWTHGDVSVVWGETTVFSSLNFLFISFSQVRACITANSCIFMAATTCVFVVVGASAHPP